MQSSSVLLAEPHHGLAEGTRMLLSTLFDAVVMVADESSLLEIAERAKPALIVVELLLARKNVAGLVARIREVSPESRVIIVSVHEDAAVIEAVAAAGADGFVVKRCFGSELVPAVQSVFRGERYFPSIEDGQSGATFRHERSSG